MEQITASVGKKCTNFYKDVAVVQTLLNSCLHLLGPMRLLSVDGKIGSNTISAIESYQKMVLKMANPDGRVDPGGKTLMSLNQKGIKPEKAKETAIFPLIKPFHQPKAHAAYFFPMKNRPAESYKTGMRAFGSRRSGGRLHAGCDLYSPIGTPIFAMDDGVVETPCYAFYLGTYAIEIRHPDFLALYGELGTVSSTLTKGAKIKKGQKIGTVGQLKGLNMSMLHLEMYSGKGVGRLTVRTNVPYKRRADLIDPTPILDKAK